MNSNSYKKQKERGLKRKFELINLKGGACEKCGYNKCIAALDFHHSNPNEKLFQIDVRHISNKNMKDLLKELDKCVLLCANCHREEHNPSLFFDEVILELEKIQDNHKSFFEPKRKLDVCKFCGNTFVKMKGKIYCSSKCRESDKNYPLKNELLMTYDELKSWEKVAKKYGITRRIIQRIVK